MLLAVEGGRDKSEVNESEYFNKECTKDRWVFSMMWDVPMVKSN